MAKPTDLGHSIGDVGARVGGEIEQHATHTLVVPGVSHGFSVRILSQWLVGSCWCGAWVAILHVGGFYDLVNQSWLSQIDGPIFQVLKLDTKK